MKKMASLLIAALLLCSGNVTARPWHHPQPPARHHVDRHHHGDGAALGILTGISGVAMGSYIIANQSREVVYHPNQYYPEFDKKCFVMVSKKSGQVSKKCVNTSDREDTDVVYID